MRPFTITILLLLPCPALAALPIELEVAADSPEAMQRWSRILGECDLARVRIRGAKRGDQIGIRTIDTGRSKRYVITAALDARDRLILPGGKFTDGQVVALKKFFQELPLNTEHNAVERGRFGLTAQQFKRVFESFSQPVLNSSEETKPAAFFSSLTRQTRLPIEGDFFAEERLSDKSPEKNTKSELTLGTTLAMFLRTHGHAMVPEQPRGGQLQLRIFDLPTDQRELEQWPVGWLSEAPPRQLAPNLYRATTIEISGFSLEEALRALEPAAGLPLVYDQYILDRKKIDPTKVQVKVARKKMFIKRGIDLVLRQARLTGEVRVDENGQPFYWITQFGKDSPRATK
ncbi:MAG: hypothetical protein RH917_00015 [Lacipirellulaceae bacterium]